MVNSLATHGGHVPPDIHDLQLPPAPLQPPAMELLHSYTDWRRDWTHIVAGKFTDSPYSSLLFYEQSTGVAEFYATDGAGGITLLQHHEGWRQSWTYIVPGYFSNSKRAGILLYDREAGFGAFYDTDGEGGIVLLREHEGWRTTWIQILAGWFSTPLPGTSRTSDLLFYEQEGGYGEFYRTDGHGRMALLAKYSDWRTTWTQIVAGEFVNHSPWPWADPLIDDLFFYEGSTGYSETYECDGQGSIALYGFQSDFPTTTHICSGCFGGSGPTNLLCYDRVTGDATFLDFAGAAARRGGTANTACDMDPARSVQLGTELGSLGRGKFLDGRPRGPLLRRRRLHRSTALQRTRRPR